LSLIIIAALLYPNFAVEIVMSFSNTIQLSVSGYFLVEKIVTYFEVKRCSEMLSCAVVVSCYIFSTAKYRLKKKASVNKDE